MRAYVAARADWIERLVEAPSDGRWIPPVLEVVASEGRGVDGLVDAVDAHLAWACSAGRPAWDARRGEARVRLALDLVAERARRAAAAHGDLLDRIRAGELAPHVLCDHMEGTSPRG